MKRTVYRLYMHGVLAAEIEDPNAYNLGVIETMAAHTPMDVFKAEQVWERNRWVNKPNGRGVQLGVMNCNTRNM